MTDPRTAAYLSELRRQQNKPPLPEPCACANCMKERGATIFTAIRNKVIAPMPDNYIPELSPNYNPNIGMIETNSKPVGIFEPSSGPRPVATKWTINKDDSR